MRRKATRWLIRDILYPVMTMMQWPRLTDADSIGGAGAFDDDALGSGVSVGFFTW